MCTTATMSSVEYFRGFVNERLTAAAEEIFGVFIKTVVEYEEEIDRQRRLLETVLTPKIKLHRIELPQQHVCQEEEVLADQQLCIQERNSSLDQEDPEPPQIKEEQEELCTSQEGEQLELKQEVEAFMLTSTHEESDHSEPEPDTDHQLLSHYSQEAGNQHQTGGEHGDTGSPTNADSTMSMIHSNPEYEEKNDSQRRRLDTALKAEIKLHRIELPQQHVCKEEEVLADQQLCIQERNSSLDQEDPEPPQIKEEQEELCTSQEGEQLELKQETDAFMLTSTHEESDHSKPAAEPDTDHQLHCLFWKPKTQLYSTELPQQHVCQEEEVLADQQLCIQERNSSLDQEDPEPPQIKEEQEELYTSQEGEQLEPKQETDAFMLTSTHEESDHSEPEPDTDHQLHSHASNSHSNNIDDSTMSEVHRYPQTGKKSFECEICWKAFGCKWKLQRHVSTHTGEKPFCCSFCGKGFSQTSVLNAHVRIHTGEKPYFCKTCGKRFTEMSGLRMHMRIHTDDKPHICKTCGKAFRRSTDLIVHLRTHSGEKPYTCETCGKCFRQTSVLKAHIRIHTGEKPYSCETCAKTFRCSSELIVHMRTHSGEKPYSCSTCGKDFISSSNLKVHMRIHTGEKPYICKTCGKGFGHHSGMLAHIRRVHTGEKP